MFLLIKPTSKCNFNCNFCSAKNLHIKHSNKIPEKIKERIKVLNPDWIVITGGDPLMVSPDYYYELLSLTTCEISLTTNLKGFYLNPDKWINLFKNPRISICTSFQYGTGRLWDKNTPYTEDLFKKVMLLFKEKVGYMPSFISVITRENETRALDHLYLAKELNTQCRLNGVFSFGASKEYYPRYKMVDLWLKIKELGLEKYYMENNFFEAGTCNLNTNLLCTSTIRACWLKEDNNLEYGTCEDLLVEGYSKIPLEESKPIPKSEEIPYQDLINDKCLSCELCRFCNACKINRIMAKDCLNYCEEMLKRKDKILKSGWRI